jgi:hypothetical protein
MWSDRLGNPRANSLPYCQLVHINRLVNPLYDKSDSPVGFWIDTLCCPTKPEWATNSAISLMKKAYEGAGKVLVLDSHLQSESLGGASMTDLCMMVHCARWGRRLWTLQEGVLANGNLFFQFNEEAIGLETIYLRLTKNKLADDVEHGIQPGMFRDYLVASLPVEVWGFASPLYRTSVFYK